MAFDIAEELKNAGTKYSKDLLTMPVAMLSELFPYFMLETSVQGKKVGGLLKSPAQLRPYKTEKGETNATQITPFERENFLGDVVEEFDPYAVLGSVYSEPTSTTAKDMDIVKRVALEVAKSVGEGLFDSIFTAVRDATGGGTADLFNGFGTINTNAITAGDMSEGKGNLMDLSATALTTDNVVDKLKGVWRDSNKHLKKQKTNMYLPQSVIEMYEDGYQIEYGQNPWNKGFEQRTLIGTGGKCNLVPLTNLEGVGQITIAPKKNMKLLVDQKSNTEVAKIRECDNPKLLQLFMIAWFGTGYETIQPEFLNVIKYSTTV